MLEPRPPQPGDGANDEEALAARIGRSEPVDASELEQRPLSPTFLTVEQVAEAFQVKPSTVYEWVRSGRLPCYRLGPRAIRFTPELLSKFAEENLDPGRVSLRG